MANELDKLLAGNPTAAGQGFRAPGFDAMSSFEKAGVTPSPEQASQPSQPIQGGLMGAKGGLVDFEQFMAALGLLPPRRRSSR